MLNSMDDNNDIKLNANSKSERDIDLDINNNINKNNRYMTSSFNKNKTYSDNNSKISKLTLLDNFLYGKEFLNSDNLKSNDIFNSVNQIFSNIELNPDDNINNIKNEKMIKSANNINNNHDNYHYILKKTTKKLKHRGGPEINKVNNYNNNNNDSINFMKNYESYEDCTLNLSKDLKCGCTGNLDKGCFIF